MVGRFDPLHTCQGLLPPILLRASFLVYLSCLRLRACHALTPGLLERIFCTSTLEYSGACEVQIAGWPQPNTAGSGLDLLRANALV